jgi:hypothetical protein
MFDARTGEVTCGKSKVLFALADPLNCNSCTVKYILYVCVPFPPVIAWKTRWPRQIAKICNAGKVVLSIIDKLTRGDQSNARLNKFRMGGSSRRGLVWNF